MWIYRQSPDSVRKTYEGISGHVRFCLCRLKKSPEKHECSIQYITVLLQPMIKPYAIRLVKNGIFWHPSHQYFTKEVLNLKEAL